MSESILHKDARVTKSWRYEKKYLFSKKARLAHLEAL